MSTLGNTAASPEKLATPIAGAHCTALAGNSSGIPSVVQSGEVCANAVEKLNESECQKPARPSKRKSTSGPSICSTRLLRSRSKEKPGASEPSNIVVTHDVSEEKKRKQRKKKGSKDVPVNEFTKIRGHLRYILSKIQYEQTLIDAYSGEGWKGQSLEKIKLEKELQRAKTQIFRYKLKIRDLFERIDSLLAEGRFPASAYDDDGQIDSEDIFCAKCGSMDLPADNDIILCDGACDRGFHQLCVEPPLLKEDIPPDDEGWLCPGCDCKVDCIDLLNDLQGTDLSVTDSWEMVYPKEAAVAASGEKLDDISGLPSDDSEDDDYNPDNPDLDVEKNESGDESESSSDESDFYSASEDLAEAPPKADDILGLPSEDSEDDDYNPDGPQPPKTESSSSDFTSDSEDLGLIVETKSLPGDDDQGVSSKVDNSMPSSSSQGKKPKRNLLKDELSYLMQSSPLVSGKRQIERLDYKKLLDETYGNNSSDSSDEDYDDGPLPKVRKIRSAKSALASPSSTPADIKCQSEKLTLDTSEPHSSGKKITYGDNVIKRLYESFKENQYPDRDTKENLGKELGLTAHKVGKWFGNARFAYHHSSRWDEIMNQKVSNGSSSSPQIVIEPLGTESRNDASCNGVQKSEPPTPCLNGEKCLALDKSEGNLFIQKGNGEKSIKSTAKTDATDQKSDVTPSNKTLKRKNAQVDTPNSSNSKSSKKKNVQADTPKSANNKSSKKKNVRVDTQNSPNNESSKKNVQVDTPNSPNNESSKKKNVQVDTPKSPNNKSSSKKNVQVDTPNSSNNESLKKKNVQVDTPKSPNNKSSKKKNVQVDTPNSPDNESSKKKNVQVDTPKSSNNKSSKKKNVQVDTPNSPNNESSKKNVQVDTQNSPNSKSSKKKDVQVDIPNSPNYKSMKKNEQVDTPNSQNVRRSGRLQEKK